MDYTVETGLSYEEAVDALAEASASAGFKVLAVHDVAATLAAKGFDREPVSIVEVCSAPAAHAVLAADPRIGLMLPCPLMVYELDGRVRLATMLPTMISDLFPEADLGDVPAQIEDKLVDLIDEVAARG